MMEQKLIGLREAARVSGMHQDYLRVLINRKALSGVKVGRDWFLTEGELKKYLSGKRKKNGKIEEFLRERQISPNRGETSEIRQGALPTAYSRRLIADRQHALRMRVRPIETLLSARKENLSAILNEGRHDAFLKSFEQRYASLYKLPQNGYVSLIKSKIKYQNVKFALISLILAAGIAAVGVKLGEQLHESALTGVSQGERTGLEALNTVTAIKPEELGKAFSDSLWAIANPAAPKAEERLAAAKSSLSKSLAAVWEGSKSGTLKTGEAVLSAIRYPLSAKRGFAGIFQGVRPFFSKLFIGADLKETLTLPVITPPDTEIVETPKEEKTKGATPQVDVREIVREQLKEVTRIVERREVIAPADLSRIRGEVTEIIQIENNKIRAELASLSGDLFSVKGNLQTTTRVANAGVQMVTVSQKIDNLNSIDIDDGATIRSGNLTVSAGSISVTGDISASATITGGSFTASNSAATSTFAGGFIVDSDTLVVDAAYNRVGIGTSSPFTALSVVGNIFATGNITGNGSTAISGDFTANGNTTLGNTSEDSVTINAGTLTFVNTLSSIVANDAVNVWSLSTSTALAPIFSISTASTTSSGSGAVGIGTSTPFAKLSVQASTTAPAFAVRQVDSGNQGPLASFFDGAAEIVRIDSAGNLGIGTTTPSGQLAIEMGDSSFPFWIGDTGTSSPSFVVTGRGLVGIGTSSPAATLSVSGTGYFTSHLTAGGALTFTNTGNHDITASSGTLRLGTTTIIGDITASTGGIDIGTAAVKFGVIYADEVNATSLVGDITGGNSTAATLTVNSDNATADTENANLAFERGSVTPNALITWNATLDRFETNEPFYITGESGSTTIPTLIVRGHTTQTADILQVATSSGTVFLKVTEAGRVGIGTSTPGALLSVAANGDATAGINPGNLLFAGVNTIYASSSTTTIPSAVNAYSFATSNTATPLLSLDTTNSRVGIGTTSPGGLLSVSGSSGFGLTNTGSGNTFYAEDSANDTTPFVIDASGNVGIGTAAPSEKLYVVGSGRFTSDVYGDSNLYAWDTVDDYFGIRHDGTAGILRTTVGSVNKDIQIRPGDSTAVTIKDGGNVGIGTTTPATTLSVQGHCVTGDTRLRRRRRKKGSPSTSSGTNDFEYDEVRIDQIETGDEIASLNEKTGRIVWSKVNGLLDMGVKPIYKLTTASGKTIRTTGEHPYLVRLSPFVNFVSEFNLGNIKNSFLAEELNAQFPYAKTVSCRLLISKWLSKLQRVVGIKEITELLFNSLSQLSLKFFKFLFGLFNESILPFHNYAEYIFTRPALMSRSAFSYSRLMPSLYSSLNGQRSSSVSMSVPRETDSYVLSGSVSKSRSSILHTNSQNAIESKRNQAGSPLRSEPTTALNFLGSLIPLGAMREKCLTVDPARITEVDFDDFFAIENNHTTSVATLSNGKWMKVWRLRAGMEIAVSGNDGKIAVWDRIISIEHLPEEQVYDITVEGTHNFIGNDIVAHNTLISGNLTVANITATGTTLTLSGLPVNSLLTTNASGVLTASSTPTFGNFNATSTVATSTISTGGFAVGASQFVVQQTSGNVGIGTTSPGALLSLAGSSATANSRLLLSGIDTVYASSSTTTIPSAVNAYSFATSNTATPLLSLDTTNSRVGIGTAAPSAQLTISNSGNPIIAMISTGNDSTYVEFQNPSFRIWQVGLRPSLISGANARAFTIRDSTAAAFRLLIDPSGNVGIGTTSPYSLLTLYTSGATAAASPQLVLSASSTVAGLGNFLNNWAIGTDLADGGKFKIASSSVIGTNDRFVIDGNGNVGIGTTSPATTLSVQGHCVTGDTRLKRRRRRKKKDGSYEDVFDDARIDEIKSGDEIASLNEKTGRIVWSKVNGLLDMGVKPIYKLTTASGKTIRTTAEHPYLVQHIGARTPKHSSPITGAGWLAASAIAKGDVIATTDTGGKEEKLRAVGYIDYANLKSWLADKKLRIDLNMLRDVLTASGVSDIRFYYGSDERGRNISFFNALRGMGYAIITKQVQYFAVRLLDILQRPRNLRWLDALSPVLRKTLFEEAEKLDTRGIGLFEPKANFDVEITADALEMADTYDAVLLFSGDGDFADLARRIRAKGKRVIVISGRKFLSGVLMNEVNTFVTMERLAKAVPGMLWKAENAKPAVVRQVLKNCTFSIAGLLGLSIEGGENCGSNAKAMQWEHVEKIERTPEEQVYDIEVEGTHNFIGNDIVAHNTLISGNITSVANITATGTLALTGTTGTSTIASGQGFTIGTSQFVVQQTSGNVGIGTAGPGGKLEIQGRGSSVSLSGQTNSVFGTISSALLDAYTIDTTYIPDYSNVGLAGVGGMNDVGGQAGMGVFGYGFGGAFSATGGRFVAQAYDAVPAYGLRSSAISFAGGNGYGMYLDAGSGAGTNWGVYQSGASDKNYFAGNLGIGTTSPATTLSVQGHCVLGNTRLRIRRRRKGRRTEDGGWSFDDYNYFEIEIKNIEPDDEVFSLNEKTGAFEYRKIEQLWDMGVKPVYKLITASGRTITTTGNHAYLTRKNPNTKGKSLFERGLVNTLENPFHSESPIDGAEWMKVYGLAKGDEIACPVALAQADGIGAAPSVASGEGWAVPAVAENQKTAEAVFGDSTIQGNPGVVVRCASISNQQYLSSRDVDNHWSLDVEGVAPSESGRQLQISLLSTPRALSSYQMSKNQSILFDRIVSIQFVGNERVYDITVEGTHNFIGNDIVAHNTLISGNLTVANITATGTTLTLSGLPVNSLLTTNASGVLTATSTPTFGNFNATSTVATSTIAGGLAIETSGFVYDYSTNNVGIGTAGPGAKLQVSGGNILLDNTQYIQFKDSPAGTAQNVLGFDVDEVTILTAPGSNTVAIYDGTNAKTLDIYGGASVGVKLAGSSGGNSYILSNALGIGEAAPGSKLSVSGGATIGASYDTTAAPTNGMLIEGNVGIGTTSPATTLSVQGHCVTGDTRLRRRRRRKGSPSTSSGTNDFEYDEVRIDQIETGDEIASLNEKTGHIVWSKVNGLLDMGVKPIYKLTTASGKTIRTTAEHPYFVSTRKSSFRASMSLPRQSFVVNLSRTAARTAFWFSRVGGEALKTILPGESFRGKIAVLRKLVSLVSNTRFNSFDNSKTRRSLVPASILFTSWRFVLSQLISRSFTFSSASSRIVSGALRGREESFSLDSLGGVFQSRSDVGAPQRGEISQDFFGRFASPEHFQHLPDHNASSFEGGLAVADFGIGNDVFVDSDSRHILHDTPFALEVNEGNGKWVKVVYLREGQYIAVAGENRVAVWDVIVKIEHLPAEQVYDIEVEGTHNFVAGHYLDTRTGKALTPEQEEVVGLRRSLELGAWSLDDAKKLSSFAKKVFKNQKAPAESQDSLARWAVDLHHTRVNEPFEFQSMTRLSGFTHQSHRKNNYSELQNENNPEIASEIVFSPLMSMAPLTETLIGQYIKPESSVKSHSVYNISAIRALLQALVSKLQVPAESEIEFGGIVAHNTLISGNLTVANITATGTTLTLSGLPINSLLTTNASGVITATSTPTFGNFNATSTTATSTISTGGFAVGTSQFVVQQTSGNVGIGTAGPGGHLSTQDTGASITALLLGNNADITNGYTQILFQNNQTNTSYGGAIRWVVANPAIDYGTLTFNTNKTAGDKLTEDMRITDGKVGIGTTTPNWLLQVNGTRPSFALSDSSAGANLKHWLFSSMGGNLYVGTSTDAYGTSTPAALTITNAGNVGVGTAGPGAPLHIVGGGDGTDAFRIQAKVAGGDFIPISFYDTNGTTQRAAIKSLQGTNIIDFFAGTTGVMRGDIRGGGSVLIGSVTNSPQSALDVSGGVTIGSYATVNAAPSNGLIVSGNVGIGTTSPGALLSLAGSSATANSRLLLSGIDTVYASSSTTTIPSAVNAYSFATSNTATPLLSLDTTNSRVGIGITAPTEKLDVAGNVNLDQFSSYKLNGLTVFSATTTTFNTLAGLYAGANIVSTSTANTSGLYNTALGYEALRYATSTDNNTAVGYQALSMSSSGTADNSGYFNSAFGYQALSSNTSGYTNNAFGYGALKFNTIGYRNSAFGYTSLVTNTTGYANVAVGQNALGGNTTGYENSALGFSALGTATSSSGQVAIGYGALDSMITGPSNDTEGNTALGYNAGTAVTYGGRNILLGYQAGDAITTGSGNIILGYDIDAPSATGNNQLSIGNLIFATGLDGTGTTLSSGNVGIGTANPEGRLDVVNSGVARLLIGYLGASTNYYDANTHIIRSGNGSAERMRIDSSGVGIGTTSPATTLSVQGHCVLGNTRLRIRRRRKGRRTEDGEWSFDDYDYFEIEIKNIEPNDEVFSLNEKTGAFEYRKIEQLWDMGVKPVYKLITASGRTITTTGNHAYLTRKNPNTKGKSLFEQGLVNTLENPFHSESPIDGAEWMKVYGLAKGDEIAVPSVALPRADGIGAMSASGGSETFGLGIIENSDGEHRNRDKNSKDFKWSHRFVSLFGVRYYNKNNGAYHAPEKIEEKKFIAWTHDSVEYYFTNLVEKIRRTTAVVLPVQNTSGVMADAAEGIKYPTTTEATRILEMSEKYRESNSTWSFENFMPPAYQQSENDVNPVRDRASAGRVEGVVSHGAGATEEFPKQSISNWVKWDRIVSIQFVGNERVYDITVEGTHNFIGNDIVAHNTLISGNITSVANITATGTITQNAFAYTSLTASTEYPDVNLNLARTVQFASGNLATQRAVLIQAPTYSFTASSTLTDASTLSITGAPKSGTFATTTNVYALNIAAGSVAGAGIIPTNAYGLYVNAPTGATNNYGAVFATGNVGIGTASPIQALHVVGQCVTGDTKLRRKRKKKRADGTWEDAWEEVAIKDIQAGDEVLTLDERTGTLTASKVNALMDMGVKATFALTTSSGKKIRTTAAHPYFARQHTVLSGTFEVDQSGRIEDLNVPTFIAIANEDMADVIMLDQNFKRELQAFYKARGKAKFFAPITWARAVAFLVRKNAIARADLILDIEYTGYESLISQLLATYAPDLHVRYLSVGKRSAAHLAAHGAYRAHNRANKKATEASVARVAKSDLHPETSSAIRSPLGRLLPFYSRRFDLSRGRWVKAGELNYGSDVLTADGWEKIISIKKVGNEQVYDIEVEGTHNFVGNDIIAHNTYISTDLSLSGGDFNLGTGSATTTLTTSATAFAIAANATTTLGTTGLNIGSGQFVVQQTSGNVGIGTAGPTGKLVVVEGSGNAILTLNNSNTGTNPSSVVFQNNGTQYGVISTNNGGRLGIDAQNSVPLQLMTEATVRMTIDSSGNVGIGTTSPATTLSVQGNALISGNLTVANITATGTTLTLSGLPVNSLLTTNASGVLTATSTPTFGNFNATSTVATSTISTGGFAVGTSQFVVQQTSGNVGIGTAGPYQNLAFGATTGNSIGFSQTTSSFIFSDANTGGLAKVAVGATGSGWGTSYIQFQTHSDGTSALSNDMIIKAGNVGIGTTSPYSLLTLYTSGSTAAASPQLVLSASSTAAGLGNFLNNWAIGTDLADGGKFKIASSSVIGTNDRFVIDGNGNVGIGTAGPSEKLHVAGGIQTTGAFAGNKASAGGIDFSSGTRLFSWGADDSTKGTFQFRQVSSAGALSTIPIEVQADGDVILAQTTGSVGIGTTGPAGRLEVQEATAGNNALVVRKDSATTAFDFTNIADHLQLRNLNATANNYADLAFVSNTDTSATRVMAGIAGVYTTHTLASYAADLAFLTSSGGTAPTEKMRITSGGNVGIGTTSPSSLLSVSGSSGFGLTNTGAGNTFYAEDSANDTTPFVIDASGNVGIGTAAPGQELDVQGAEASMILKSTTGTNAVFHQLINTGGTAYLGIESSTGGSLVTGGLAYGLQLLAPGTARAVQLGTNGNARLTIDSTGNVGIGTTSPATTLSVQGNALISGNLNSVASITATGTIAFTPSARTSGATPYLTLTGAADTGLTASTEAPDIQFNLARTKTHANGALTLQRDFLINAATHAFTSFASGNTTDLATLGITGAPLAGTNATTTNAHTIYLSASTLNASTTNSYGLTVNANTGATNNYAAAFLGGNVGIGTAGPQGAFDVVRTSGNNNIFLSNTNTAGAVQIFWTETSSGLETPFWITRYGSTHANANGAEVWNGNNGWLRFATNNAERVRIDNTGNVGVGTTSPATTLSVQGNALISGNLTSISGITATGTITAANFVATGAAATSTLAGGLAIETSGFVYDYSTGNVGIGTATPGEALEVYGLNKYIKVTNTAANDTKVVLKTLNNEFYMQTEDSSFDGWGIYKAAPATAGWQMVITTTGNLGVGTTSPAWLLQVNGTRPSFALSDSSAGANLKHWLFSSMGGNLYVGTSSDAYATSSTPMLTILSTGLVGIGTSTPSSQLSIEGRCVDTGAGCADIAELYSSSEPVEAGNIVAVDPENPGYVRKARRKLEAGSQEPALLGIVSSSPAMTIEGSSLQFLQGSRFVNNPFKPAVALSGQVPLKVSLEGGEIKPGDRVTISSEAGIGMKATTSTYAVGIALKGFDGWTTLPDGARVQSERGDVLVFVNLGYAHLDLNHESGIMNEGQLTNAWSVDQVSGKVNVNFYGDVNLNGNNIINVAQIVSQNGLWRLDDSGRLTAKYVETEHLTVGSSVKPTGITLFDQTTKEPYCLSVNNGAVISLAGTCESAAAAAAAADGSSQPPVASSQPTTETTNETATTTQLTTPSQIFEESSGGQAHETAEPALEATPVTQDADTGEKTASSTLDIITPAASTP